MYTRRFTPGIKRYFRPAVVMGSHNVKPRHCPRIHSVAVFTVSSKVTETNEREGAKWWRENSSLRYWVIGALGIAGSIYCYVYRNLEKKRLLLESVPSTPNHFMHPRERDIVKLGAMHSKLTKSGPLSVLYIVGSAGSGKTQLARAFAEKLRQQEEERYRFLPGDLLFGTVNASSLENLLFDLKRFALSAGCLEAGWSSKSFGGKPFCNLSIEDQLYCFISCIKEKLKASQGWVLILDNVKDKEIIKRWFSDEPQNSWGKGTILVTASGSGHEAKDSLHNNVYSIDEGLHVDDGVELLQKLSGLSDEKMTEVKSIVMQLNSNPLLISCAAHYMQCKAAKYPSYTDSDFLNELNLELQLLKQDNCDCAFDTTHAVIAMETRNLVEKNPHLRHTFDMLGSCAPGWPVPITLIALHLQSSDFGLPPVVGSGPTLPDQQLTGTSKVESLEEVQEMFLSIKKLARNLESFMTAVKENVNAIKMMINAQPADLPPVVDGVVKMLMACPLVKIERINPMGVDTLVVSPLVHAVFQQLFTCNTMYWLETEYLEHAEKRHNAGSWFRRLWRFDAQRTLQEYRNSLGEVSGKEGLELSVGERERDIRPSFASRSVQKLLRDPKLERKEEFRKIKAVDTIRHCHQHAARILKTINEVASVCGQDNQTRTLAMLLKVHLDHILTTSTSKSLGPKSRAHAVSAMASIDSSLGNLESSRGLLEQALGLERQLFGDSSLEVASTLTRLADIYNSMDDTEKSQDLLERALRIYESQRKKFGEYKQPLNYARTLSALGATYGTMGFKHRSRDYIERAFSVMQSLAPTNPSEVESRRFTSDVTSTLTDLGHAYLSLGEAMQARRLLDLAVNGLKNIHGDEHPEVVRALTVLGIAYSMQGNWIEARRIRNEAGKLQARIDAKPLL